MAWLWLWNSNWFSKLFNNSFLNKKLFEERGFLKENFLANVKKSSWKSKSKFFPSMLLKDKYVMERRSRRKNNSPRMTKQMITESPRNERTAFRLPKYITIHSEQNSSCLCMEKKRFLFTGEMMYSILILWCWPV